MNWFPPSAFLTTKVTSNDREINSTNFVNFLIASDIFTISRHKIQN